MQVDGGMLGNWLGAHLTGLAKCETFEYRLSTLLRGCQVVGEVYVTLALLLNIFSQFIGARAVHADQGDSFQGSLLKLDQLDEGADFARPEDNTELRWNVFTGKSGYGASTVDRHDWRQGVGLVQFSRVGNQRRRDRPSISLQRDE